MTKSAQATAGGGPGGGEGRADHSFPGRRIFAPTCRAAWLGLGG